MAIDPSIALQAKLPQLDSPLNSLAQASAIQNAQNQNALAQYGLAKAKREDDDTQAVRNLLTGAGGDLDAGYNALIKGGYAQQALALKKQQQEQAKVQAEMRKSNAEADNKELETRTKKWSQAISDIAGFDSPEAAMASLQSHVQAGDVPPERAKAILQTMPQNGDKAAFRQWQIGMISGIMDAKDRIGYMAPTASAQLQADTSIKTTGMNNATSVATNAATNATLTGNNIRTTNATLAGQNAPQYDPERGVLVDKRTSTSRVVTGADGQPIAPKDKALTETQGKATGFAARAQQADKLIASLDYSPSAINSKASVENTPMVGGMLGALVNSATLSAADQRAEQAQRDFINAILRQESGAAIGKDEFTNARKQYFPQPGDDAATIAQKATNRRLAVEALRTQAGPGAKQIDGMIEASNKQPAQRVAEAVKNGEVKKIANTRPAMVKTAADYARLPSGAIYTAPDGSMRTKQ